MKLPDYPRVNEPIPASWGRQVVDALRALFPRPSPSVLPRCSSNGTTFDLVSKRRRRAAPAEGMVGVSFWPRLVAHDDGEGGKAWKLHIREGWRGIAYDPDGDLTPEPPELLTPDPPDEDYPGEWIFDAEPGFYGFEASRLSDAGSLEYFEWTTDAPVLLSAPMTADMVTTGLTWAICEIVAPEAEGGKPTLKRNRVGDAMIVLPPFAEPVELAESPADLPLDADVRRSSLGSSGASVGASGRAARADHRHDTNMPGGNVGDVYYFGADGEGNRWHNRGLQALVENITGQPLPDGSASNPHMVWDDDAEEWIVGMIVPPPTGVGQILIAQDLGGGVFKWTTKPKPTLDAGVKAALTIDSSGAIEWSAIGKYVCPDPGE